MKTNILLARHGETAWTESDQFNGRTDIPISERGHQQAYALSKALAHDEIAACYASPLQRCQETARIALGERHIPIQPRDELVEMNYGRWEGLERNQIIQRYAEEWKRWSLDPAIVAPVGGETGYQIAARVIPCLLEIISECWGKTVLVVAHKTVNRITLAHVLGIPISEYRRKLVQSPSGLNRIEISENWVMRVGLLNDTSHYGKE